MELVSAGLRDSQAWLRKVNKGYYISGKKYEMGEAYESRIIVLSLVLLQCACEFPEVFVPVKMIISKV